MSVFYSKSLAIALCSAFGGPYVIAGCLKVLQDCLAFLQPQLLRLLLSFISRYQSARPDGAEAPGSPSALEGFSIAILMFMASMAQTVILHQVSAAFSSSR